jgi:hypothetical protein
MPKRIKGGAISVHDTKQFVEQSYLLPPQRSNVGSYQLDGDISNARVAVFYDPQANAVVVANRGTTGTLSDWSNNLLLVAGQYESTDRFQNALDTQLQVKAKYPTSKITNIAHSQSQAIVANLNNRGLTHEVITLNGATQLWDKQAKNETRIRSNHDLVSAVQTLGTDKRRNTTIQGSWNPLYEHSTKILDRLNPLTYFGSGIISNNKQMPPPLTPRQQKVLDQYQRDSRYSGGGPAMAPRTGSQTDKTITFDPRQYGGGNLVSDIARAASPFVDRYTTTKQKAALKKEAKKIIHGLGLTEDIAGAASPFIDRYTTPKQKAALKRDAKEVIHGLGLTEDISSGLSPILDRVATPKQKKALKTKIVKAIHGLGIGMDIAHALGHAAISGINNASTRLTSALDGSDPSDRTYGGSVASIHEKVDRVTRKGLGMGYDIAHALGHAAISGINGASTRLTSALDGSDPSDATYGGLLENSPEAKAHAIVMRAARKNPELYAKGTDRAKGYAKKNAWIEYVKQYREEYPNKTWAQCMKDASEERKGLIMSSEGYKAKRKWAPAKRV